MMMSAWATEKTSRMRLNDRRYSNESSRELKPKKSFLSHLRLLILA